MQPFSPDENSAEVWQNLVSTVEVWRLIALAVGSIILGWLANWVASLCVAGERATLGRAVLTWLAGVALGFLLVIIFAVLAPIVARTSGPMGGISLVVGFFCALLAVILGVPMKIYEIGVLRSVGFVVIAALVAATTQTGLQFALIGTLPFERFDRAQVEQIAALFARKSPEEEAAKVEALRAALRERQADLSRRHAALEIRRKYLPQGSSSGREAYEEDRKVYERDLEQLRAEASALPAR